MPREESVNPTSKTDHSNVIEEPTATLVDDCIKGEEEIITPASYDPIDIKDFESLGLINSVSSISHTIDKGQIPGSSEVWFRKEFADPAAARREWLAQEFLRLIIPNQTETRLAFNSSSNVYYILSKEVPGFKPLPTHEHHKFSNGTYKGLGRIIMGAYFVHEADLKNGNVGIGDDNLVHKIDGDWSFASMRSNGQFPKYTGAIAAVQINRLPFPMTYKAHNWLDIFIEGSLASASDIVASDIGSSPQFQEEKFETLFKLLLIPNEYFNQFVDSFMPAGAKEYSDFLTARRNTLLQQASRVQGFSQYLIAHNDVLEDMAMSFQGEMEQFVIQGKYSVLDSTEHQPFRDLSKAQFNEVLAKFDLNLELHDSLEELKEAPTATSPTLAHTLESLGMFSYKPCGSKRKLTDLIGDYADFSFKP